MIGAMAPTILLSIVPMEMLKNNLILLFNIAKKQFNQFQFVKQII